MKQNHVATKVKKPKVVVVIPNWNGKDELKECIDSLLSGSLKPYVIVVDNGSQDRSVEFLDTFYNQLEVIKHDTNKGFAGGVNPGMRRAIELQAAYVAPFNNDAVADKNWLQTLVEYLDNNPEYGIASCKVSTSDGKRLDSTGDYYTSWGLVYARGRNEIDNKQYDKSTTVFGASGAASLYRVTMLEQIGLLDNDFFAYFEDVDLSFRAQLAGWKIAYVPVAVVFHKIGGTSKKIEGFYAYQATKNYPWLLIRNVPARLLPHIFPRFLLTYTFFIIRCFTWKQGYWAVKGLLSSMCLLPKKLVERHRIQSKRKVTADYIWSIITHDLPPQATEVRKLRSLYRKLIKK